MSSTVHYVNSCISVHLQQLSLESLSLFVTKAHNLQGFSSPANYEKGDLGKKTETNYQQAAIQ